jgi:hypothetical protein
VRKITAILLIAVLLFNVFGYYGLFLGLRLKTTHDLITRLDAEAYSTDETLTLKLPLSVPYHVDQNEYERVDGEIEYKGEYYRLVKQKLTNDTLYVVCLADKQSKNITRTFNDYAKTLSDKHASPKGESGKAFQNLIKDYIATTLSLENSNGGWSHEIYSTFLQNLHEVHYFHVTVKPPEA